MQNPQAAAASESVSQSSGTLAPGTDTTMRNGASSCYLVYRAWADGVARFHIPGAGPRNTGCGGSQAGR
jgi:hypothetical protein